MKFAVIIWCFIVTVGISKGVLSSESTASGMKEDDYYDDESTTDKASTLTTIADPACDPMNFTENGAVQLTNHCTKIRLNLDFTNKASIINLTMSIERKDSLSNDIISTAKNIRVDIYEPTHYEEGGSENILQRVWDGNWTEVRNYLSLSSRVYIDLSSGEDCWDCNIEFTFQEIEYRLERKYNVSASGERMFSYRPNAVIFYSLNETADDKRFDGIEIKFKNLIINKTMGEYLLIGPGTELFKSDRYKPLYITELTEYSKFYVGARTAYVAFVSGSTQMNGGFEILWSRKEIQVPRPEENVLGDLNSSLICFNLNSTGERKFEQNKGERFKSFKQDFAELIYNKKYYSLRLNETSVVLFGYPRDEIINSSKTLTLVIKVMHNQKSIFKWSQLQAIIGEFEKNTFKLYDGYHVGRCSTKEFPYKDEGSFIIYAMAPMFALCALFIWAWKQNIFAQKCKSEEKDELSYSFPSPISAEPNTYENTIPKNIEASEDAENLKAFISRRSSRPRRSMQSLYDLREEATEVELMGKSESKGTEHLYNSVNSSKSMGETRL